MFTFGKQSEANLIGVNEYLVRVVRRGLELTPIDFSVTDGLRTIEEQREYFRTGASKTMASKHLTGLAVDLTPWVNGKSRFECVLIFDVMDAIRRAAKEYNYPLTWGGAWDRNFTESVEPLSMMWKEYIQRRLALGKDVFSDGPHIEYREIK